MSGVGVGGGNRDPVRKRHPEALYPYTKLVTTLVTNHSKSQEKAVWKVASLVILSLCFGSV